MKLTSLLQPVVFFCFAGFLHIIQLPCLKMQKTIIFYALPSIIAHIHFIELLFVCESHVLVHPRFPAQDYSMFLVKTGQLTQQRFHFQQTITLVI